MPEPILLKKLIPAFSWAFFILLLCFLPGSAIPELTFLDWLKPDKLVHLFLFGVLSFLLVRPFSSESKISILQTHSKLISFVLSAFYGIVVEVIQEYFIPGRYGDVYDSISDALGALTGIWFFKFYEKRKSVGL